MLPKFPEFKKLELADRADVEAITSKFEPYSDFNFKEMWSWNIHDSLRFSDLNGNLVVEFNDYISDESVLSFLGDSDIADTINQIFEYQAKEGVFNRPLKFVPEVCLAGLDPANHIAAEDQNNNDYVYDLNLLATYDGPVYRKKRTTTNAFIKRYPNAQVRPLDLSQPSVQYQILELAHVWADHKIKNKNHPGISREQLALERFFAAKFDDAGSIGLFIGDYLAGFTIFSYHPPDYVVCHFTKADVSYKRIYDFLVRERARILRDQGYKFLDDEEDMGLEGLRVAKSSYRPVKFLKKYFIKDKHPIALL
jgi:hypothetical protein